MKETSREAKQRPTSCGLQDDAFRMGTAPEHGRHPIPKDHGFHPEQIEGGKNRDGTFTKGTPPVDAATVGLDQARRELLLGMLFTFETTLGRRAPATTLPAQQWPPTRT